MVRVVGIDTEDNDREIYAGTCFFCEDDVCDNCGDCHNPECRECEDLACYMWQFYAIKEYDRQQWMNDELRDAIGRALYESSFLFDDDDMPTWEELCNRETWIKKSAWIARAEKVIEVYNKKGKKCLFCESIDAIECIYDAEEHGIEIPMYLCLKCFDENDISSIKRKK